MRSTVRGMTSGTDTSVLSVPDIQVQVGDRVEQFIDSRRQLLEAVSQDVAPLADAVANLSRGGKRLRAAFAYVGWVAAGGPSCSEILTAAASLELLQACALIHDDIMDGSDVRRGLPSAHRQFEALHAKCNWSGSAENFGAGAAILAGDLCLSWADEMLLTSGLDAGALGRGKHIYDLMRAELMAGQYLDLVEQARGGGSVDRARTVIRFKSAKYTIERPLHLGGALAGASDDLMQTFTHYGLALGEAFQLRDDVLGVFGVADETGKPCGDDLREGKQTLLVAFAMESASDTERAFFGEYLGNPSVSSDEISRMQDILIDTGALDRVEALIEQGRQSALDALAHLSRPAASVLAQLAVAATSRRS